MEWVGEHSIYLALQATWSQENLHDASLSLTGAAVHNGSTTVIYVEFQYCQCMSHRTSVHWTDPESCTMYTQAMSYDYPWILMYS